MRLTSPQMNIMYKACMKAARPLIRDYGEIEKLQVSSKSPGDFVTSSDKRIEKIIIDELLKADKDSTILSEEIGEVGNKKNENKWILDPIDGTLNFLNGIPYFCISLAFEKKNESICGMVFDPIKNEIFFAEKGNGSFLNNTRIRVSKKNKIEDCLLVTGGPKYQNQKKDKIFAEYVELSKFIKAPIRKFGSAALDISNVACGRFDGFWQHDLNYWDIAAGKIILKEAGGFINIVRSETSDPNKLNIVATNAGIHEQLNSSVFKKKVENN